HAQASGDFEVAAELVATAWMPMSERGHAETVRSWIAGFDDAQIEAHPPLAIAAAWVVAIAGEAERAVRFAGAAQRGSWQGPMPDGTASFESALAIMSSSFGLGGLSGMRAAAERAVDLEPATSSWRPLALLLLGISRTLQGDFVDARDVLDEVVELAPDQTPIMAFSLALLAAGALQGETKNRPGSTPNAPTRSSGSPACATTRLAWSRMPWWRTCSAGAATSSEPQPRSSARTSCCHASSRPTGA
ncbi:MAG: hypothetical protein JO181_13630, partial [Solirubrobacterales bacterium]|nr:hypothetical protein [Solirubrobacterales bacterium]